MENFIFQNPTKIIFGKGMIYTIGKEIKNQGISKILLLAGSGSIKSNGVYNSVINSLNESGIEWTELWGVQSNPVLKHAQHGIEIFKKDRLEAILAIGGGSVIDEAKSISAGVFVDNLWDIYERKTPITQTIPIYTVLTISGTCSEMDANAVLTNEDEKKKWAIGSPLLYPKISIIDPEVQCSLPWQQTVNGGIDAMSHIMEHYFIGTNQEVTLALDESLMRTIIYCLDVLQNNQNDYSARASLAWTATLGLNGISGAGLIGEWSAHRIEHGISALFPNVAHGAGLAVVFPAWIEYVNKKNPDIFARWSANVWNSTNVDEAIKAMKLKFAAWGAPVSLSNLLIAEVSIVPIAENAIQSGVIGNKIRLKLEDIINILKIAM